MIFFSLYFLVVSYYYFRSVIKEQILSFRAMFNTTKKNNRYRKTLASATQRLRDYLVSYVNNLFFNCRMDLACRHSHILGCK